MLQIAKNLQLPPEAMTLTSAVLGIRGSGKTNTGVVFTEELLAQAQQVIVIDPLDVWWGLKSSADGQAPGYAVVVLGGAHGDLPLAATDGEVLANFLAETRTPAILSLRHLRKGEQKRFVADFAEAFYRKKGEPGLATPVLVVIDEASSFVPQSFQADSARCVGAIEDLVRRGRASGLGVMLIDQRAASVNKDVLTQLELLVAHRHTSPQDRNALKLWVQAHDTGEMEKTFMESLASLPRGEAWFWSPGWLDLFSRVLVRKRRTFDSSATPELGAAAVAPTALASLDLDALRAKLDTSADEIRSSDPKVLKTQVDELKAQLKERPQLPPEKLEQFGDVAHNLIAMGKELHGLGAEILGALAGLQSAAPVAPLPVANASKPQTARTRTDLPGAQQRILDALATLEKIGLQSVERENVAIAANQSPKSSAFDGHLRALRDRGLIESPISRHFALTNSGRSEAQPGTSVRSLAELHREWITRFKGFQATLLVSLIENYPNPLTRAQLSQFSGQSLTSSSFDNNLRELRDWGLATFPRSGEVRATALLFPNGLK